MADIGNPSRLMVADDCCPSISGFGMVKITRLVAGEWNGSQGCPGWTKDARSGMFEEVAGMSNPLVTYKMFEKQGRKNKQ